LIIYLFFPDFIKKFEILKNKIKFEKFKIYFDYKNFIADEIPLIRETISSSGSKRFLSLLFSTS